MISRRWFVKTAAAIAAAVGLGSIPKIAAAHTNRGGLIARAGEVVTCENGHEICDVARDIFLHDHVSPSQFTNWRNQPAPQPGENIRPCHECGADYISAPGRFGGHKLRVAGEWRPAAAPAQAGA